MEPHANRRDFLRASTVALTGLSALGGCAHAPAEPSTAAGKFRFAHLTDLHIQPELGAERGVRQCIEAVNRLDPRPDFVITGGDLVMDTLDVPYQRATLEWNLYDAACRDFDMPLYNTIGNHDILGWAPTSGIKPDHLDYGKKIFMDRVGQGQTYRAFDHRGWHFILLDSIVHGDNPAGYVGQVDEAQIDWLARDLEQVGRKRPIVVVTHIPFFSTWMQMEVGPNAPPDPNALVGNAHQLRKLLKPYNVKLVLQGHMHTRERIDYLNTSYILTGAVCGQWWKGPTVGDHPEGFGIIDLDGDRFDYSYATYGWKAVKA